MTCEDCAIPPDDPPAVYAAWRPDPQLVPAVLARSRPIRTLTSKADKCWVVAGLHVQGLTAEEILDRLKCSLRLVRTLLADPMTKVFILYHAEVATFREELSLTSHELRTTAQAAREAQAEHARVREQRDRLIDMAMTGEPVRLCKHGHVMDRYNTYVCPTTGKRSCRTCRREAKAASRRNLVSTVSPAPNGGILDLCAPEQNEPPDAATPVCRRTPERAG